jgi:hypothetical protein
MLRSSCILFGLVLSVALVGCSDDDSPGGNNSSVDAGMNCLSSFEPSETGETCVYNELVEVTRTQCGDIWEDCDESGSAVNLSCLGQPDNPPANPPTVTLQGYLDVFSAGPEPTDIKVQVFDPADLEGVTRIDSSITPLGEVTIVLADLEADIAAGEARACFSESDHVGEHSVECPVPTADCGGACQDDLSGTDFCYHGTCYDRMRYEGRYAIDGIPTHQPLVIRTAGLDEYDDQVWGVMAQVNVYLRTTDDEYDETAGTYELDANVLSRQDWYKIPQTMGLSGGMSPGYSALAGEVHDCDGIRITGAQVALNPQSSYFAYFNGNPLDTVPLTARLPLGTNSLSVYAEFELPAGPIDVEAWGLVGGTATMLGQHHTFLFEDSVTVLSINDGKPTVD